jgi:hypothetical protein
MKILKNSADIAAVNDAVIRQLIMERYTALVEGISFEAETLGYFVLVEPADGIESLEQETGCPIGSSWFDDARYGDDDFVPSWEFLQAHETCYEMVFVLNDDSFAISIIIPKTAEINQQLLNLCKEHADYVPI